MMSFLGTFARLSWTNKYNRLELLDIILCTCEFHFMSDLRVTPKSSASCTVSKGFPLTTMGGNILLVFLKSTLNSLHFLSCKRNKLLSDHSCMLFTDAWIVLGLDLGTVSDIVRSSVAPARGGKGGQLPPQCFPNSSLHFYNEKK